MSRFYLFLFLVTGLVALGALSLDGVQAAACVSHNVFGWAWSDNIGWVSFSCETDPAATADYGVDIDSNGLFSGYAWSDNVGWLSFEPIDVAGCPGGPPCQAEVDPVSAGAVSGWAKVLSSNSWFKLSGLPLYKTYIDSADGQFHEWAWSDDFGWLSFNCVEGGDCDVSDYKVETNFFVSLPPNKPVNLEVELDNCGWKEASVPKFSWTYDSGPGGKPQTGYEIQLDADDSTVSSPEFVWQADSGSNEALLSPSEYKLEFNHSWYYWKVRVKNDGANWSEWSNVDMFNTPLHAWPWVDFAPVPGNPGKGQVVSFIQDNTLVSNKLFRSLCYSGAEHLCQEDANATYLWEFGNGIVCNSVFNPGCKGNANTSYDASGAYSPALTITDSTVGACKYLRTIRVGLPFPEWQEIKPR